MSQEECTSVKMPSKDWKLYVFADTAVCSVSICYKIVLTEFYSQYPVRTVGFPKGKGVGYWMKRTFHFLSSEDQIIKTSLLLSHYPSLTVVHKKQAVWNLIENILKPARNVAVNLWYLNYALLILNLLRNSFPETEVENAYVRPDEVYCGRNFSLSSRLPLIFKSLWYKQPTFSSFFINLKWTTPFQGE